jgi:uncharacterized protein YsxB (DUF464 family)
MIEVRYGGQRFEVTGHAGYSARGTDIVCAAVSAIVEHTIRNLRRIKALEIDIDLGDGVQIGWRPSVGAVVLVDSMIHSLESLSKQYPEYVKVIYE